LGALILFGIVLWRQAVWLIVDLIQRSADRIAFVDTDCNVGRIYLRIPAELLFNVASDVAVGSHDSYSVSDS
jgi:hypothetical protein